MNDFLLGLISGLLIASFGSIFTLLLKFFYDKHLDRSRAIQKFYSPLAETLGILTSALLDEDLEKDLVKLGSMLEFILFNAELLLERHNEYYSRLQSSDQETIFSLIGLIRFTRDKEIGCGEHISTDTKSELLKISSELAKKLKSIIDCNG